MAKVLVVDDIEDWRRTLSGMLVEKGYGAETAGSLRDSLALLETNRFDLALVDVRLDEQDEDNTEGLDLADEIRRRWPAVKVVIITGYETTETVRRAMEPNAQGQRLAVDFIKKTEIDKLAEVVKQVLTQ